MCGGRGKIRINTHPGNLQILPPSFQPRAIRRRTQLAPGRLLAPSFPRARRAPDAPAAVGYRVGAEGLGHEGGVAEQHHEVVAVTQVFERLGRVLDRQLGDGRFGEHVFVDCPVQRRCGGQVSGASAGRKAQVFALLTAMSLVLVWGDNHELAGKCVR